MEDAPIDMEEQMARSDRQFYDKLGDYRGGMESAAARTQRFADRHCSSSNVASAMDEERNATFRKQMIDAGVSAYAGFDGKHRGSLVSQ